MKIDILTIFPEMFNGPFGDSILKRAQEDGHIEIKMHNLRDWTKDNHRSVDDKPFGGGAGMVMRVDLIDRAVTELKSEFKKNNIYRNARINVRTSDRNDINSKVILLDTKGKFYNQSHAQNLSRDEHLILIVPHYEGVDHRVHDYIADEVYSIGPYVLTGGELPAMVLVDSVVRLIPGVINEESLKEESYSDVDMSREYPQYTRPAEYKGWKVPEMLLSGHHAEIEKWRKNESEKLTQLTS